MQGVSKNTGSTETKPWEGDAYIAEPRYEGRVEGNEAITLYEFDIETMEHFAEIAE